MELNLEPVKVDLQIETPSLERGAFYNMCFITENDEAPRTLKVTRLQDLLDNGYSRLDLAYNFCVGVFSQQGMDTVYIRAKRSYESYVDAYNSDDNSIYYFVVLQTKDLTEVEKFNKHLVSFDEMKLQFFSQNVGSKIFRSPKLVNYYQDYTISDGVSVESKDYYLNKVYSGITVVNKIPLPDYLLEGYGNTAIEYVIQNLKTEPDVNKMPLPDYLLEGYGNTAVDFGMRVAVGEDYNWEIDKPNRQIRYARSVVESGWVGSREESTINNSEVTVVATKGVSGKLLRASIKDPKVKIETISRQFLKGLGKEVLDYAIPLIDPEATDWVLDPENSSIKYYPTSEFPPHPTLQWRWNDTLYDSAQSACSAYWSSIGYGWAFDAVSNPEREYPVCVGYNSEQNRYDSYQPIQTIPRVEPIPESEEKTLPLDVVAAKVISNSDGGHLESKEFLKSIPLFAYLLTGSGTEAVNKAVLDIDPEATDWVLDPANNSVKYTVVGAVTNTDCIAQSTRYPSAEAACNVLVGASGWWGDTRAVNRDDGGFKCMGSGAYADRLLHGGGYCTNTTTPTTEEKPISIDTVAQQVISNAESGHAPSQEALRLSTEERVDIGEYDEALEAASIEIETSWNYLPIYDVAVQVKRNSIAGHPESIEAVVNSLPFEIPNYEPNITITGITKVGEILTATVTDENGVPSNINYQWYANGEVISGATAETYVLKESDSGKMITVQADFMDKDGFSESVTSTLGVTVDMGLREYYSGSGWYKATDTGIVYNKGVPPLENHVFSDSPKEYVSVYTKEDAKLYGERAAVSNITNMEYWFESDTSFNEDISSWDVSLVTNTGFMFFGATSFNQDLSSWDTSKVTNMGSMFEDATSFSSDISNWDVSSVTDMNRMFRNATSFNSDISNWDVSSVTDMNRMFTNATSFNSDISNWDVSSVTDMGSLFYNANSFIHDISSWDVSNVTDMSLMFESITIYNHDLSSWDVSSVTDMYGMFKNATSFNSDISSWDVSKVTDMYDMFEGATTFNQDLSKWCVTLLPRKPVGFDKSATAWTLPKPVWGTCPIEDVGDIDTPWAYVPEETSVTGSTTTIKAKRTFENQKLKSSITVTASASKVGESLIKGGGSDALAYAVPQLIGEDIDWVLDPVNSRIKYAVVDDTAPPAGKTWKNSRGITNTDPLALCRLTFYSLADTSERYQGVTGFNGSINDRAEYECRAFYSPDYGGKEFTIARFDLVNAAPDEPPYQSEEKYIPYSQVAQKIISNAESGHTPSREAVKATALESFVAGEYDVDLDAAAVIDN